VDTSGDYSGKYLPGIPSEAFNLNFSVKMQRHFHFFADYQHIGMQYMTDDNSKKYTGYKLVGVKIVYESKFFKRYGLSLYTGIQNLFNEQYASMVLVNAPQLGTATPRYYYPGNPRSFYAGLKISSGK
jgi:iron complex outermembrane receptor protein